MGNTGDVHELVRFTVGHISRKLTKATLGFELIRVDNPFDHNLDIVRDEQVNGFTTHKLDWGPCYTSRHGVLRYGEPRGRAIREIRRAANHYGGLEGFPHGLCFVPVLAHVLVVKRK